MSKRILLIYPPHTRNTEPPIGLALLASTLIESGISVRCLDLNATAGPALAIESVSDSFSSRRSHRAARHIRAAIDDLRSPDVYRSYARYRTAVEFYGTMLRESSTGEWRITPGDLRYAGQDDFSSRHCSEAIRGVLNDPFASYSKRCLLEAVSIFPPDTIGISFGYRSQLLPGLRLISHIRHVIPGIPIIIGGSLLTTLPDSIITLMREHIERVVIGPGEEAILGYAGVDMSPSEDGLPRPEYTGFDFGEYFSPGPVIPYSFSRGCYWSRCAFCMERIHGYRCVDSNRWRTHLHILTEKTEPSLLHFTDNAIPRRILESLARHPVGVPWYGFVRPDSRLTDRAFVKALAESGCTMLQLGLETPVQRLLDIMRKGTNAADYPAILDNLRSAGIRSYVYLLFGLPNETHEDREDGLAFAASQPIDYINPSLFRLPEHADLAKNPGVYGIRNIEPMSDDSHYRYYAGESEQRRNVRLWLSRRFSRHEHIRTILSHTPPFYKSNHAVYFHLKQTS